MNESLEHESGRLSDDLSWRRARVKHMDRMAGETEMTDRDILLMAYGALKVKESETNERLIRIIEAHIFAEGREK